MISIQFPPPHFKIETREGVDFIFDRLRKKWVVLTPEEWVRQNFIQYLLISQNIPASLIAVEREFKVGDLSKRFDILVFDRDGKPWLLVECKSMEMPLDDKVLAQMLRYYSSLPVPYFVITNGMYCSLAALEAGVVRDLDLFPDFG